MLQDWFFIGVDLGQRQDYSAIVVIERTERAGERDPVTWAKPKIVHLTVRHLERIPLGTSYLDVVRRVVAVTRSGDLAKRCTLVVDGSGVGQPVVDMLRDAGPACDMYPVMITPGEVESKDKDCYRVPKQNLVSGLQVVMEQGQLTVAGGLKWEEELAAELGAMRAKPTPSGRGEQYGAWKAGTHDDLVMALSLACWGVRKTMPIRAGEWALLW